MDPPSDPNELAAVIRTGTLRQKGRFGRHKTRIFQLLSDGMLRRGKTASSTRPYALLAAGRCSRHKSRPAEFRVTVPSRRIKLRACSAEEAEGWVADVSAVLRGSAVSPFKPLNLGASFEERGARTDDPSSEDDASWHTAEESEDAADAPANDAADAPANDDDEFVFAAPSQRRGDAAAAAAADAGCADDAFSAREREAVAALRARVQAWAEQRGGLAVEYVRNDGVLWRYSLAHAFDVDAAAKMFRASVAWKEDVFGMAEAWREWRPRGPDPASGDGAGSPRRRLKHRPAVGGRVDDAAVDDAAVDDAAVDDAAVDDAAVDDAAVDGRSARARLGDALFYAGFVGRATGLHPGTAGAPVVAERLGRVDLGGIAKSPALFELLLRRYAVHLEATWRRAVAAGPKRRALVIVDLAGLDRRWLWHVGLVRRITAVGPPNYPETCGKVWICNAPRVFKLLWSLVAPFLPERTKAKVEVLGCGADGVAERLAPHVEGGRASLPRFLGGDADASDVGPAMRVDDVDAALLEAGLRGAGGD
jgi:hypothetical protein